VKIRSKRTVVLGAILGGLLAAGSVAAHATDLPLLGNAADNLKVDSLMSAVPLAGAKANSAGDRVTRVVKSDGIGSGNDVKAGVGPVSPNVPVNACGIGANVLVSSGAHGSCRNTQTTKSKGHGISSGDRDGMGRGGDGGSTMKSVDGILSGNDILAGIGPVSPNIPVSICGIAANVLGGSNATGACDNNQVTKSKGSGLSR